MEGSMKSRNLSVCVLLLGMLPLMSCGSGHSGESYVLIAVNVRIPYWQSAGAGISHATQELGLGYNFTGPDAYDPAAERDELERAIASKPAGILISVADAGTV